MLDTAALLLSHVLNPAAVACMLFGHLSWKAPEAWLSGAVGVCFYSLVPGAILYYLYSCGHIGDVYLPEPGQRARLLLWGSLCYWTGFVLLWGMGAPALMLVAGCAFGLNALLVWAINRCWKISIHATGVGGGLALMLAAGAAPLWVLLPAPALVVWARLRLHAHTPAQLVAGLLLGIVSAAFLVMISG